MHESSSIAGLPKEEAYRQLNLQLAALLEGERNGLANAANTAALLFGLLEDVNWAGFYFMQTGELVLGPFQGRVACVRIAVGKGVCGTAARERKTMVVPDVNLFPGHIVCDSASRSEIVIPLLFDGDVVGVLDLDSPRVGRFDLVDAAGLEAAAAAFVSGSDLGRLYV